MHKRLPIVKLPQPGPYTGPYCTNDHDQREKNVKEAQEAAPTLWHDIPPVVFHQDAPVFSPNVLLRVEEWPALPARADTAHAAPAFTKTAAPYPAAPAAFGSRKIKY